jgi:hypothetical protein
LQGEDGVWITWLACTDGDDDKGGPEPTLDSGGPTADTAPLPTNPTPVTTTEGGSQRGVVLFGGNDRVRGDDDGFPVGAGARTVQAWVRTHSYQEQIAVSYGRPSPAQGFLLGTVDGHPFLRLGSGLERVVIDTVDLADDQWHLLAVSWDGSLAAFSVDGAPIGSGRISGETLEGDVVAGNTPTGDLTKPWYGWLDDVKVIEGIRLTAEVEADPDAERIDPAKLLLWWDFEGLEGQGNSILVPDVSGNERTGQVGGTEETPRFVPCR